MERDVRETISLVKTLKHTVLKANKWIYMMSEIDLSPDETAKATTKQGSTTVRTFNWLRWEDVNSSPAWGSNCLTSHTPSHLTSDDTSDRHVNHTNESNTFKNIQKKKLNINQQKIFASCTFPLAFVEEIATTGRLVISCGTYNEILPILFMHIGNLFVYEYLEVYLRSMKLGVYWILRMLVS